MRSSISDASDARKGPRASILKRGAPLARFVVHEQQEIRLEERARRSTFPLGPAAFRPAHQDTPPAIGRGVADAAEERPFRGSMERSRRKRQRGFESEALGMPQPAGIVFERGALASASDTSPETTDEDGCALKIDVDEDFPVHHASRPDVRRFGPRIRCGSRSLSRSRPTVSCLGSARSASRSVMPKTKSTEA